MDVVVHVEIAVQDVETHAVPVVEVVVVVAAALLVMVHAQMAVPDVAGAALHAGVAALAVLLIVRAFAKTRALHRVVQLVTVHARRRLLAR